MRVSAPGQRGCAEDGSLDATLIVEGVVGVDGVVASSSQATEFGDGMADRVAQIDVIVARRGDREDDIDGRNEVQVGIGTRPVLLMSAVIEELGPHDHVTVGRLEPDLVDGLRGSRVVALGQEVAEDRGEQLALAIVDDQFDHRVGRVAGVPLEFVS